MRRYGERVISGKPYKDRPGAYALITKGSGLLLVRTSSQRETLLLPGGGIDPGESPLQALHREVLEETGWRIAPQRRIDTYQRYVFMPDYGYWARKVCHVYLCTAIYPLRPPSEPDHQPEWWSASDAAEQLSLEAERHFASLLT